MERFFQPLPSCSRHDSASSISWNEEEESRPATPSQGDIQPALASGSEENVALPKSMHLMGDYFLPGSTKQKLRCKLCRKEITYSASSNYNLKSHYERIHRGEYTNFLAALSACSKRGRNPSGARYENIFFIYLHQFNRDGPTRF
jgi:hypothetical protein